MENLSDVSLWLVVVVALTEVQELEALLARFNFKNFFHNPGHFDGIAQDFL
jgi:hypothetical protein